MSEQPEGYFAERFPQINWDEPQPVTVGELTRLTCRYCTAIYGLKASDLARVGFETREEWAAHQRVAHMTTHSQKCGGHTRSPSSTWLSLAACAANEVIWWRALHSPPRYFDLRTFCLWWPPAVALSIAGIWL